MKTEKIPGNEIDQDPAPIDGYYIDPDSIERYEHAILGVECMSCIMVNHDPKKKAGPLANWRVDPTPYEELPDTV